MTDDEITAAGAANESDDTVSAMSVTTGLIAGYAAGAGLASGATLAGTRSMKPSGKAIYDTPAGLKKFLLARASGNASKELLMQLSADAMVEQEAQRSKMPRATVIDLDRARRERSVEG
jgi:hypothetical protein